MQVKSFSAKSAKEVLSQIKEELGPEAVILDSQEEDGLITMTAALERGTKAPGPKSPGQTDGQGAQGGPGKAGAEGKNAGAASPAQDSRAGQRTRPLNAESTSARTVWPDGEEREPMPPGWQRWHEEWSSIKNHLLALMKPAMRLDGLPPRQRVAIEFLQREGMEDTAALHLSSMLQNEPNASILSPLGRIVPMSPWGRDNWRQSIQVIAGPFGAGKTSVAIRLALSLRKSAPGTRICLLNADSTRGNGRLLLRHYCELSNIAYKEAATTLDLVSALNQALNEGFERVIVDLPGLARGRYLNSLLTDAGLAGLTGVGPEGLAVHLVLPPHYGSLQLGGILERYRTPHAGSIIWTKLDEAEHYGQIINVAVDTGLPVSALSFGAGLGNSLAPVKENMLWRLIFKRELPLGL
ncbi:MAG: flagellar biosynthesis protein FlhF [Desulfovibrio sp.]|jgi:flagellar biosynthesis protein FlhF|nr:flagellar biosynthesis protein FlhF [Desulfovibrio sp.]